MFSYSSNKPNKNWSPNKLMYIRP